MYMIQMISTGYGIFDVIEYELLFGAQSLEKREKERWAQYYCPSQIHHKYGDIAKVLK